MYADYVQEREGKSVIWTEYGFIKYSIEKDMLYIEDIYVVLEHRHKGHAQELADGLVPMAKARGCKMMIGSVSTLGKGKHKSMLTMIAYGMELYASGHNIIYFKKDI